jgi:hypothetical protein
MNTRRYLSLLCSITLITTFSVAALAQSPRPVDSPGGYRYDFDDDDLLASPQAPTGDTIWGEHRPLRTRLLRPRTHFVVEMLKSVETL